MAFILVDGAKQDQGVSEPANRYSDRTWKVPRQQISRLAFLLAGLLIAVTAASLVFVGLVASHASNRQAIDNEQQLFDGALAYQLRTIVREQISVASSDEAVARLVNSLDPVHIQHSFDTLWTDYRHNKVVLISGGGEVLAESFDDYIHIIRRPVAETPELQTVHEKLKLLYQRNRVRVPGGFGHRSLQGVDPSEYALMGFTRIDGKPAIFGAMPIVPDKHAQTLPDGPPTILFSARYLDSLLLKQLNAQLRFESFSFVEGSDPGAREPFHLVSDPNGEPVGTFKWASQTEGTSIWPTVIPVIAVLSVALAALAFGIAWRIGQLTSSLQASEQQNRFLALHDTLTGLGNRLQFNRSLEASVEALPEQPFAVVHCDLDKFKAVNDTFGHAAGDKVIRTIAERLQDIIAERGLACRIGGDEFMLLYKGTLTRAELTRCAKAMIRAGNEPISLDATTSAQIGMSVGIAIAPEDGATFEQLVARSDAALYHSKKLGRGRYSFFEETFLKEEETSQVTGQERARRQVRRSGTGPAA